MERGETELKKKLEIISKIYNFAQEVYSYSEYFHKPNTKEEFNLFSESIHSIHLCFIKHLMFRILIIEVSKLFSHSNNDKYRLESFINSLAKNGDCLNKKVESWKEKLDANKGIICYILQLRNKIYAHTDNPLNLTSEIEITFEKIKSLLDFALEVINSVYKTVCNGEFDEKPCQFDRERFFLLKLLAKGEALRIEELTNEYKV